jgi:hypothetical protein
LVVDVLELDVLGRAKCVSISSDHIKPLTVREELDYAYLQFLFQK